MPFDFFELMKLPTALSPSRNWTPGLSCATTTDSNPPRPISRMSRGVERQISSSLKDEAMAVQTAKPLAYGVASGFAFVPPYVPDGIVGLSHWQTV
jgi:hypothetical protein